MIPINAKYDNNKQSAKTRSYLSSIIPLQAGPYTDGSTINIHIPCTQNFVLSPSESVLEFNLTATNSGTASVILTPTDNKSVSNMFDHKYIAHAIFGRISVWHESNLLEDLNEYGLIASKLEKMCNLEYLEPTNIVLVDDKEIRSYSIKLFSILGQLSKEYNPGCAMSQSDVALRLEIKLYSFDDMVQNC